MKKNLLMILMCLMMIFTVVFSPFLDVFAETSPSLPANDDAPPDGNTELIELKFVEGSTFRLREGVLTAQNAGDLVGVNGVFNTYAITKIERLFSQPEHEIEAERAELMTRSGEPLPDLNLWYRVWVPEGVDQRELIAALNALPEVQTAYPAPIPAPLPSYSLMDFMQDPAPPPAIPNYESNQGYLNVAPGGIDAKYAWTLTGGKGQNVQIVDVEYNFNKDHVDFPTIQNIHGALYSSDNHGTAVFGELVAKSDGVGVTGIANLATPKFAGACADTSCTNYKPADAINAAKNNTVSGDVILIEQQYWACGYPTSGDRYGPLEWLQSVYDATKVATTAGRIVVAAAGNGYIDLDGANCNNLFNRSFRDSGAIIVGAGAPPGYTQTARSRLDFSSYGSRVDVQGWGRLVYSTGYGDLYGSVKNEYYTATFSGTSSASPIVAGAAALLSSVAQARSISLTPLQIRSTLVSTGSPQQAATGFPVTEHIGPLPDLKAAITSISPVGIPKPVSPTGYITDKTPTFKWTRIAGASRYQILLKKGTTTVYTLNIAASCVGSYCTYTPGTKLPLGSYTWQVKAKVGTTWGAYSAVKKFTLVSTIGFNSSFNTNALGWKKVYGPWGIVSPGYYRSNGIFNHISSVVHDNNYPIFVYTARMMRKGDQTAANRLYVRGYPWPLASSDHNWDDGYYFQYANTGDFSVWKVINGTRTAVKGWTASAKINKFGWNTLKVVGVSNSFKFYINNTLVWQGKILGKATGRVGIGAFRSTSIVSPLSVDWATLTIPATITSLSLDEPVAESGETIMDWDNPNEAPPVP